MEVYGIGVLITGDSGVGKSETALELIERGHRLISDDTVKLKNISDSFLVGSGENPMLAHHMEIRGLGIINLTNLFGVGAIREKKQVELSVFLETAARNERLKKLGYYSSMEFDQNVLKWLESEAARKMYFSSDDVGYEGESGIDQ